MFARVATIATPGASVEQGIAFFRDRVLPDVQENPRFRDAMLLVSRDGEDALVLTFWDTEANLRSAEAMPAPHRTSAAREALGPQTRRDVHIYEVAFRAESSA